ncbi:MAG: hypothetical protein HFE73_06035 [Firmicutes bacterium]|nr:hypothetical protein [Bacillota bacterium]
MSGSGLHNWNRLVLIFVALFTLLMVLFPKITEAGSKTAIIIWANSIVPVLLPFFIFSDFIKRTMDLSRLPIRIYPFVVAVLSGYPMGAKVVSDLVEQGSFSKSAGKWVLSYSLVTGPAFLMGTIGSFLGSSKGAVIVVISHYVGAMMNGWLWSSSMGERRDFIQSHKDCQANGRKNGGEGGYLEHFTEAIIGGFKAMALILAYLIVFMIGIDLLETAGVFRLIGNETISSLIKGLLEMTAGANMVGLCNISLPLKTVLISFLVSFGGFSVIGQSMSMAQSLGIRLPELVKIKGTHGLIAGILAGLLVQVML